MLLVLTTLKTGFVPYVYMIVYCNNMDFLIEEKYQLVH